MKNWSEDGWGYYVALLTGKTLEPVDTYLLEAR
jgi:hypothetical protein